MFVVSGRVGGTPRRAACLLREHVNASVTATPLRGTYALSTPSPAATKIPCFVWRLPVAPLNYSSSRSTDRVHRITKKVDRTTERVDRITDRVDRTTVEHSYVLAVAAAFGEWRRKVLA